MKTKLALSMALMAALSTFGATSNASELNSDNGTTSDLPHTILSCVETVGGAEVLDGRVEVKVGKDQFGQFDVEVTQKEFNGNDYVLAHFLAVQWFLPDWSGAPLTFLAKEEDKEFSLTLWSDHNAANTSNGKLVLIKDGERRELEVRCDM